MLTTSPVRTIGAPSRTTVVSGGRALGTLFAGVPLTDRTLLVRRAGLTEGDTLVVVQHGSVVSGPRKLAQARLIPPAGVRTLHVGGKGYRALATSPQRDSTAMSLAVISPQSRIDAAVSDARTIACCSACSARSS